jgi:hypothetical protein
VFIAPARTRIGHSTNVIGRLLLPPLAALALAAGSAAATTPASAFTTIRACLTKAGAAHVKPGHTNRATFPGRYRRVTWSYVTS